MNVLIVDDSDQRAQKLQGAITLAATDAGVVRASCAQEARAVLSVSDFNLMIIDINLPLRRDGMPSSEVSLDLISELLESSTLRKPTHIVGITMYDSAAAAATETFSERLWALLKVEEMNDEWLLAISNTVRWIVESANSSKQNYGIDLLLITALASPEMEAVHRIAGWTWKAERPLDRATFYREGEFVSPGGKRFVVTSSPTRMGMVPAALRAAKLIAEFRPRFCVMAGICAGVRGKVDIGDIIFADPAWDYQSGKFSEDKGEVFFNIAPHQVTAAEFVRERFALMRSDAAWLRSVRDEWLVPKKGDLQLHIGPLASGSAVLADGRTIGEVQKNQQRQLLGIDMELYGIYSAGSQAAFPAPTCFGVKSVCDFADTYKSDKDQSYAAYTSASAIGRFFGEYYDQVRHLAGTV